MKEVELLENRVNALAADNTSPHITKDAVCAVFRDVLIPMLNAEIKATGLLGFAARWALGKVKGILEGYLARNCGVVRPLQG